MNSSISFLLLTALLSPMSSARAGAREAGGAIAVHCNAGTDHETYELLDLYEATAKGSRVLIEAWKGADRLDLIEWVMSPIAMFDWSRASNLQENAKSIDHDLGQSLYLAAHPSRRPVEPLRVGKVTFSDGLERIHSDFHVATPIPANCELVQLAVRKWQDRTTSSFVFNKQVWLKLDLVNQAAAILHEVIYQEDRAYNHSEYSDATRYEVGVLFTTGAQSVGEFDAIQGAKDYLREGVR